MGNLNGHNGPLPQQWIDTQRELQLRILERERALGMTPVIQAFAGFVPPAFVADHPDLEIQRSSGWCGFEPTYLLNPAEPMFVEIGKRFTKANGGPEADLYEQNARRLITRWGDHGNLSDYARKEWTGLLNGYYGMRWNMFFDRLKATGKEPFDWAAFNEEKMAWAEDWLRSTDPVKEHAEEDEIAVVRELMKRYGGWHLQLDQKTATEPMPKKDTSAQGRAL